jgi:hypothetical protein
VGLTELTVAFVQELEALRGSSLLGHRKDAASDTCGDSLADDEVCRGSKGEYLLIAIDSIALPTVN